MENWQKKESELIIFQKDGYDFDKTIDFFRLKLIDMFKDHNLVTISCIRKYLGIANTIIEDTKHMGFLEYEERKIVTEEGRNPPHKKLEYIKISLELIPALKALKRDREKKILRETD